MTEPMQPGDRVAIMADRLAEETGMDLSGFAGRRGTVLGNAPIIRMSPGRRSFDMVRVSVDGDVVDERVFDSADLRPLSLPERVGELEA